MLTGYQTEVVAFIAPDDGEYVCYDCARKTLDESDFERSESGLGSLSPVSRYSIDEENGERIYAEAEERIFDAASTLGISYRAVQAWKQYDRDAAGRGSKYDRYFRLVDRVVEKLGDSYGETCGDCGEVI